MKITIEATPKEIAELLQAIASSKEQNKREVLEFWINKTKVNPHS